MHYFSFTFQIMWSNGEVSESGKGMISSDDNVFDFEVAERVVRERWSDYVITEVIFLCQEEITYREAKAKMDIQKHDRSYRNTEIDWDSIPNYYNN